MRELLSFRFAAAVAGILALLLFVRTVTAGDEVDQVTAGTATRPVSRVINLAERLDRSTERFAVSQEGLVASTVTFTIEEQRAVTLVEGTIGVNDCTIPDLARGNCAIFADLLGEAVIWFSLQPVVDNDHVVLPPVTGFERGRAVLENGMRLAHAPAFIRRCPTEYASFTEMRTDVGTEFVSWWSFDEGELTDVARTTQ